jgi:hypothetical protein
VADNITLTAADISGLQSAQYIAIQRLNNNQFQFDSNSVVPLIGDNSAGIKIFAQAKVANISKGSGVSNQITFDYSNLHLSTNPVVTATISADGDMSAYNLNITVISLSTSGCTVVVNASNIPAGNPKSIKVNLIAIGYA